MQIKRLPKNLDLQDPDILNCYLHGSRVYGTDTEQSDFDYIVIKTFTEPCTETRGNEDFSYYSKDDWNRMALNNDVDFIECLFLPDCYKCKETFIPDWYLDKEKIRSNFSRTASNSWVKCKKKLTIEKDFAPYIGKKSLWHSFRLLNFGCQLLQFNEIIDYTSVNYLYDEIVHNDITDWNYFKQKYQPLYNSFKSEFRRLESEGFMTDDL